MLYAIAMGQIIKLRRMLKTAVGNKLPHYCGSREYMAETTEAAEIQLKKVLKQLAI